MMNDQAILDALNTAGIDYDVDGYQPQKTFRDNGIDSLDVMSLFLALQEKTGISFTTEEVSAIQTPAQLLTALNEKASAQR